MRDKHGEGKMISELSTRTRGKEEGSKRAREGRLGKSCGLPCEGNLAAYRDVGALRPLHFPVKFALALCEIGISSNHFDVLRAGKMRPATSPLRLADQPCQRLRALFDCKGCVTQQI